MGKGCLNVRFATQKYVYHAVHMIFNGEFEDWQEDESKGNKLVFIGKNLDAAALRAGFAECLATEANLKKKLEALRFKVGDRVECNMGDDKRLVYDRRAHVARRRDGSGPGLPVQGQAR